MPIRQGLFDRAYSTGSEPLAEPVPDVTEKLRSLVHGVSPPRCNEFVGASVPHMDFATMLCGEPDGLVCTNFGEVPVTGAWLPHDPPMFVGIPVERSAMLNEVGSGLRRGPAERRIFHL